MSGLKLNCQVIKTGDETFFNLTLEKTSDICLFSTVLCVNDIQMSELYCF